MTAITRSRLRAAGAEIRLKPASRVMLKGIDAVSAPQAGSAVAAETDPLIFPVQML